ncbi:MAG: hypothetical protein H6686_04975 [Fibrobacteria bacterium]|nr:hypothetical protein [Fibrobacteria bacterium]
MRETSERHFQLHAEWSSQDTIDALEREAERMHRQGWSYTGSHMDRLMENVVLCFEREVRPPTGTTGWT